jgi:hypothetical protein
MTGMPCMCCKKPLENPSEARIFAEVFCCPTCYTVAARTMERALADMNSLKVMMLELIRQGLLEGRLQFQPSPVGEVPRGALLTELLQMAESTKWRSQISTTATSPDAPTPDVDGKDTLSSTSVVDSK